MQKACNFSRLNVVKVYRKHMKTYGEKNKKRSTLMKDDLIILAIGAVFAFATLIHVSSVYAQLVATIA